MISTTLPRSEFGTLSAIHVGHGRPMLFLHGVGLQAAAWQAQIDRFCLGYQVIAPDMPGHGQSACASSLRTIADYANAYLPLLKGFNEPVMAVGHSMGAMIAIELAHLFPRGVRAVAALNAVFERSPEAAKAVQQRAAELDDVTTPDPTPTLARWFGATSSPERTACESWLRATNPKGYQSAYTAFAHSSCPNRKVLGELACPALFATGSDEPNSTPEMSHAMAALAPRGRALIIDGAAHMMPMTHAGVVNEAIARFAGEVWQ